MLVGGVPAPSFEVTPQGVRYTTPPNVPVPGDGIADHGHVADVRFVYDDGMLAPALFEAQPFAYLDPILLPESACRKGNVNGGAGPVANVFFVNGSPNPAGSARWAGYAWTRVPSAASHNALPFGLGNACLRMPLSPIGGVPGPAPPEGAGPFLSAPSEQDLGSVAQPGERHSPRDRIPALSERSPAATVAEPDFSCKPACVAA